MYSIYSCQQVKDLCNVQKQNVNNAAGKSIARSIKFYFIREKQS